MNPRRAIKPDERSRCSTTQSRNCALQANSIRTYLPTRCSEGGLAVAGIHPTFCAIGARVPTSGLGRMIYAYPTFHRAVEDAVRNLAPVTDVRRRYFNA